LPYIFSFTNVTYSKKEHSHSKKMLVCFNPILGKIWTNPEHWIKNVIKKCNPMAGFNPKLG